MSTAVGLQTITAPELKSPRGEDIVKFSVAYERYTRSIAHVNSSQPAERKINPVGYKACISAELLQSLVDLCTFGDKTDVEKVTDEDISNWIATRSRCSNENVASLVKDSRSRVI